MRVGVHELGCHDDYPHDCYRSCLLHTRYPHALGVPLGALYPVAPLAVEYHVAEYFLAVQLLGALLPRSPLQPLHPTVAGLHRLIYEGGFDEIRFGLICCWFPEALMLQAALDGERSDLGLSALKILCHRCHALGVIALESLYNQRLALGLILLKIHHDERLGLGRGPTS